MEINGEAKAYPIFILVWHEIINDKVGGIPVAVTYCPLCYTNQVFERIIDGEEVEFTELKTMNDSRLLQIDFDSQVNEIVIVEVMPLPILDTINTCD